MKQSKCKEVKTQINMRVTEADKEAFTAFCETNCMSQSEAFSLLLKVGPEVDVSLSVHLQKMQSKIDQLKDENAKLMDKLAIAEGKKESRMQTWAREYLDFIRGGLKEYIPLMFPNGFQGEKTPDFRCKRLRMALPMSERYYPPEEEGYYLVQLDSFLWGRIETKAFFLAVTSIDGKHYRIRHYPRRQDINFFSRRSPYATKGSWWYIGCRRANDGAMELAAAFPVGPPQGETTWMNVDMGEHREQKESLEERIRRIRESC